MRVEFCPMPYTFVEVPGYTRVWDAPQRRDTGVYLWCIEHSGAFLVNYVGITRGTYGFDGRLWTELKNWRAGRDSTAVDIEQFKLGRRMPLAEDSPQQRARQLADFQPLYRILLAPIADAAMLRPVESFIVHTLMQQPATAQFLSNRKPARYKRPAIEIEIAPTVPIIGLTAAIPSAW